MTDRVMPTPDIYASCPSDGPVLEYYGGVFDAVYVLLSPFIQPVGIPLDRFSPNTYPERKELCAGCNPIAWESVRVASGLPSLAALDVALRTQISGLKAEFARRDYADLLDRTLKEIGVIPPAQGEHSDLLHDTVLGIFQALGHSWVWVGDEFCTERKLHWIEDLKGSDKPVISGHCNVFAPDKSLLWTVHWDSYFSFLCSDRAALDSAAIASKLEGFFCERDTEVYWSVR